MNERSVQWAWRLGKEGKSQKESMQLVMETWFSFPLLVWDLDWPSKLQGNGNGDDGLLLMTFFSFFLFPSLISMLLVSNGCACLLLPYVCPLQTGKIGFSIQFLKKNYFIYFPHSQIYIYIYIHTRGIIIIIIIIIKYGF